MVRKKRSTSSQAHTLGSEFDRAKAEERQAWSPRSFYRTMRDLFRTRPGEKPVSPPFYQNRPLTEEEVEVCQKKYVEYQLSEERSLRVRRPSRVPRRSDRQAQADILFSRIHEMVGTDLPVGHPTQEAAQQRAAQWSQAADQKRKGWEIWKLAGRALFADTACKQSRARRALRVKLQGRPTTLTRLCREFLRVLPPRTTAEVGAWELFVGGRNDPAMLEYRAERQFLWAFLKHEAKEGDPEEVAQDLAQAYPYLKLTSQQISRGLTNSHQADDETAKKFGLASGESLRSILSQRRRGHRPTRT